MYSIHARYRASWSQARREERSWNEKGARFRRSDSKRVALDLLPKNERKEKNNTQSKKVYHPRGSSGGMIAPPPWSHARTKLTLCAWDYARVCVRARARVRACVRAYVCGAKSEKVSGREETIVRRENTSTVTVSSVSSPCLSFVSRISHAFLSLSLSLLLFRLFCVSPPSSSRSSSCSKNIYLYK